jgi:hypothetical protein
MPDEPRPNPASQADCAPAAQPKNPTGSCDPLPAPPAAPALPPPPPCQLRCECPADAGPADHSCLEDLIADEAWSQKQAEVAADFKKDLEDLLAKATKAQSTYTWEKHGALVKEWQKQDGQIVDLIRRMVCAFPCWRCMVECAVCRLIYALRDLEWELNGNGEPYSSAGSLYDLQYWHQRNKDARQAVLDRIKAVLAAWETPAETIEKALAADAVLIDALQKNSNAEDAQKLLYDLFLKLVPAHLAIAPTTDFATTGIESQYAELLCPCDASEPDDCCGPDAGVPSVRERLLGAQPYLVAPDRYAEILCCLAQQRYKPAKDALTEAASDLAEVTARIAKVKADLDAKTKSLEADAKTALGNSKCDEPQPGHECGCSSKHGPKTPAQP